MGRKKLSSQKKYQKKQYEKIVGFKVKKPKIHNKKVEAKNVKGLTNKYEQLREGKGNAEINKGILSAMKQAGIDTTDPKQLEKYLGVPGKSWEQVVDIIDKRYKQIDFEEIFYSDDIDENDPNRVFDGEYFKKSLTEMIEEIRAEYV